MEQDYFTVRHELPRTLYLLLAYCFRLTLAKNKLASLDLNSLCCFIFLGPYIR